MAPIIKIRKAFYTLLATATILLMASTSCEYLEDTSPNTTLLPTADQILQDARKYDQSPIEVLDRKHALKAAQLTANRDRNLTTLEERLAADTITATQAAREENLIRLKYEQQNIELQALYRQRTLQLKRERDRFNR